MKAEVTGRSWAQREWKIPKAGQRFTDGLGRAEGVLASHAILLTVVHGAIAGAREASVVGELVEVRISRARG